MKNNHLFEETKAVLSSPESNFVTLKNTISFKDLVQGGSENV